ncbi:MAG: Short-chain dehydrogenase/reductase, partial [Microbacteriaceae bacterium]|nr:Short-chain dehydrogenase/reductase [Microbacteriaceae bacterium]
MSAEFAGLSVIVTGGNAGIGKATALELLDRGARVGVIDLRIDTLPAGVSGAQADLASASQTTQAVDELAHALGGIDILVNNAGISFVGGVEEGSEDDWHHLFDINVLGYVRATRAALPYLRNSDHAAIVNVSSCTAVSGVHQRALYSATKGAIASMSLSMAVDLLSEGVRVNCVRPGTVDTPFMADLAAVAED